MRSEHINFHISIVLNILILCMSIRNLLDYMKSELERMFLPYSSHFFLLYFPYPPDSIKQDLSPVGDQYHSSLHPLQSILVASKPATLEAWWKQQWMHKFPFFARGKKKKKYFPCVFLSNAQEEIMLLVTPATVHRLTLLAAGS